MCKFNRPVKGSHSSAPTQDIHVLLYKQIEEEQGAAVHMFRAFLIPQFLL